MRILFVDVDGPLIPASALLVNRLASFERKIPRTPLVILNTICDITGAKVVMNTTHNRDYPSILTIHESMILGGFDPDNFYFRNSKTKYPSIQRDVAVTGWVSDYLNEDDDYVCIDDVVCTDDDHMELVDPIVGLTIHNANNIIERWGGDRMVFCI